MNNFWTRAITGTLFVAVMVGCIVWSYLSTCILFGIIVLVGLWEFYTLLEKSGNSPQKYFGIISGLGIFIFSVLAMARFSLLGVLYCLVFFLILSFLTFFIELFRNMPSAITNISQTLLGVIYVVFPFSVLLCLQFFHPDILGGEKVFNPHRLLGFFLLVWSNDTFAYLSGRAIGKTKLLERISPKKTWEGTIGGVVLTQGAAYVISIYFTEIEQIHWHVIALLVSVFGTLGDLVESMFKRSLGVKDSGSIFPGHGGVLDRFDGVLLSAPFVVTYLMLIK